MRFGFGTLLVVLGLAAFGAQQSTDSPLESFVSIVASLGLAFAVPGALSIVAAWTLIGIGCALFYRSRGKPFE